MNSHIEDADGGEAAKPRWKFDGKGMKNILILVTVLIVSSLMVYGCQNNKAEMSKAAITPPPTLTIAQQASSANIINNPEMNKLANEISNAEVDIKAAQGKSAFAGTPPPLPAMTGKINLPMPAAETIVGGFKPENVSNNLKNNQLSEGLAKQLLAVTKSWGYGAEEGQSKTEYIKAKPTNTSQANASTSTAANAVSAKSKRLVGAMEVASARLMQTVNSDNPNAIVRAEVLTGAMKGAVLLGKAQRLDEGIQISYQTASLGGCPLKIAAIALDENTSQDVVSGKYDGRYAARFVFPVLLEGVKAYANARSQTGSTVIIMNGSSTSQSPAPNSEQARNAMVAASVNAIDVGIKHGMPTTPQVVLKMGSTVGVLFLDSVSEDTACKKSEQE